MSSGGSRWEHLVVLLKNKSDAIWKRGWDGKKCVDLKVLNNYLCLLPSTPRLYPRSATDKESEIMSSLF